MRFAIAGLLALILSLSLTPGGLAAPAIPDVLTEADATSLAASFEEVVAETAIDPNDTEAFGDAVKEWLVEMGFGDDPDDPTIGLLAAELVRELQRNQRSDRRRAALTQARWWAINNSLPIGAALLAYFFLLILTRRMTASVFAKADGLVSEKDLNAEALRRAEEALSSGVDGGEEGGQRLTAKEIGEMRRRQREAERLRTLGRTLRTAFAWLLNLSLALFFLLLVLRSEGGVSVATDLFSRDVITDFMARAVKIGLVIFLVIIVMRMVRMLTSRIQRAMAPESEIQKQQEAALRAQTLINVLNGAAAVFVWAMGAIMILDQLGLPIAPLIAGAGVIGLAIGFGAQSLVRDFLSGFFILIENQYRVGDVVEITGIGGLVERITLRCTYLRDLNGNVHIIPNGEIKAVTNRTFKWSRHVAVIGVSYNADPDQVIEILREVGVKMRREEPWNEKMWEDPEVLGLDEFADSSLNFKVIIKTKPLQQWAVGREYNRRVFYAFEKAGVEIPFPHRTVYMRMEPDQRLAMMMNQEQPEQQERREQLEETDEP